MFTMKSNHSKADESDEGYDADLYYVSKSEDKNE